MMETRLFIFVLISFGFNANGQESDCRTSDGGVGICKSITECPSMLEKATAFASADETSRQTIQNELRKSYCGYANESWKVCCSECKTPDGKSGLLKYIRNCPHLWNLLTGRTPQGLIYVRDSRVNNQSLDVCCGPDPSSSDCNSQITALPPDPSTRCCGIDIHAGSRIAGGKTTDIDEYPWTVLLEYELKGEIKLYCGGSLISNRYVLTAAHCITGDDAWPPKNVRVGEFDTLNTGRDCVLLADGVKDCTDGAESISIDSITVHSEYEVATHRNDIALIRLRDPVRYTEFVRPICLPTSESVAQDLTVVGWGKVNMTHRSRHKQSLRVRLVDGQDCQNTYKNSAPLWDKQICAGGETGKDSCNGDSGGPLMGEVNPNEPRFELAGLVSFGPKRCGTAGKPGIYTNVYKYLDWIRANMRQ